MEENCESRQTIADHEQTACVDESYLISKKKKKRKRQYGHNETFEQHRIANMKKLQNEMEQVKTSEESKYYRETFNNHLPTNQPTNHVPDENADEAWSVPKKKQKKHMNKVPAFVCDLDKLFASYGKRAQGSHIKLSEIRSMYMLTVNGNNGCLPTWCRLNAYQKIQKTIIIMAGYICEDDYLQNKDCFKYLNSAFEKVIPVRHDGSEHAIKSPTEAFLNYRMTKRLQQQKRYEKNNALSQNQEFYEYILTDEQLKNNEYPQWNPSAKEHGILSTRPDNNRKSPTKDSKLFAIDCEMCNAAGNEQVLTRISIVNSELETVYDTLVKPDVPITDYVTQYSGITAEMLEGVTTRLSDVQHNILTIIQPDTILVGHSLDFDLRVLKIHHDNVIDTSVLYVDQRGPRYKSSLKNLVKTYLSREIQSSEGGHCSIEDAKSCMELVLLKIQKGAAFGNPDYEFESIFEALNREGKQGAIIDVPHIVRQHCFGGVHGVPCTNDTEVVQNASRFFKNVQFTFAHLRTYENLLKDNANKEDITIEKKQEAFRAIDKSVSEILSVEHPESLVIVSLSGGYVPPNIVALNRDKEKRKLDEVRMAMRTAKNAVCFIKVT